MSVKNDELRMQNDSKSMLGFWIYLMTDVVLFATLFATFIVLKDQTAGGPGGNELFSLSFVLIETMVLLTSSFTAGIGLLELKQGNKKSSLGWFGATFVLGLLFLGLELSEFIHLASEGHNWQASAFLSSFFTLVSTHGLHIVAGLIWMAVLMVGLATKGLRENTIKRFTMFSLFWHFLDIVWIFIFSVVYLIGSISY